MLTIMYFLSWLSTLLSLALQMVDGCLEFEPRGAWSYRLKSFVTWGVWGWGEQCRSCHLLVIPWHLP